MEGSVLVIGGGIAGIQTSLDLTELGFKVYLVEKSPSIGGRMAQLDKTFPTNDCSLCILAPKMVEVYRNPNIELLTYHEVKEISGTPGDFTVTVLKKPRYLDETKCKGCGDCAAKCPKIEVPNIFDMNFDLDLFTTKLFVVGCSRNINGCFLVIAALCTLENLWQVLDRNAAYESVFGN